jgi:alkanesulfonate monooxygenase SsuD/methylene tetrahydromethanopterin reductase-like flavin-dependent oxidoreductase (luciferase family)
MTPFLTPDGIRRTIEIVRNSAADAGRDPAAIKFYAVVIVAPDLPPDEQAAVVGGRAVTYFQVPEMAKNTIAANGWDPDVFEPLQSHPMFAGVRSVEHFRREQLVEVSRLIPREILLSGSAVGTAAECAAGLEQFFDAGADEIVLHGATPDQCGPLIEAFRAQRQSVASSVGHTT